MIKEEIILKADEFLQELNEKAFEDLQAQVAKTQPHIVDYVLSMSDLFDDEEEYFNKFYYFFMLIHRSFSNRFRFLPQISKEQISKTEEQDQAWFLKISELAPEESEEELELMIKKHPQRVMIDFITLELFESDVDSYDDIRLEMDNQIFFLLISIINIYELALTQSQPPVNKAE